MYLIHNEGKLVVAERFIRALKNKIYKYMIYKENNNKDPKSKVGHHLRISKYKNIFVQGYTPNWSKEV